MWAQPIVARACLSVAAICIGAGLWSIAMGIEEPGQALAKKGGVKEKLPPGLAKKLPVEVVPQPSAPTPSKPIPPGQQKKAQKPAKPPKTRGPKADPPQAQPSDNETPAAPSPPTPAQTPASEPTAPATTAPTNASPVQPRRQGASRSPRPAQRGPTRRPSSAASPSAVGIAPTAAGAPPATDLAATRRPRQATGDGRRREPKEGGSVVTRTVRDIVEVVPDSLKLALAALAGISLLLAGGYVASALRARSLARQRRELLGEVGLLQSALLPPVPEQLGALRTSVAYRPADGPGAGGDFYDALPLPGGRAGFILGDVSGHGHGALERTAFMRYTLRAYLEAGLEPRVALQVAGRVIGDRLNGDFATVLIAVHDPGNGSLTYASAGHPAPIVAGGDGFEPVNAGASPPIGVGVATGVRQTTVPLMPGTVACLYTDGLIEARTDAGLLGVVRLQQMVAELGPDDTATDLLERVASEAQATPDDMATCLLSPTAGVTAGGFRTEHLELSAEEASSALVSRFLAECGVTGRDRRHAAQQALEVSERFGGAMLTVVLGGRRTVEVLPRNVESIEAAALRAAGA